MARKTDHGRHIISAGEISTFVVCPEAWRLARVKKVDTLQSPGGKRGQSLHEAWNVDVSEAFFLTRSIKFIMLLILLSLLVFVVSF